MAEDEKFKGKFSKTPVKTPQGRVCWVKLLQPDIKTEKNVYGDGKYKVTLCIPKQAAELHNDEGMKPILKEGVRLAKESWGNEIKYGQLTFAIADGDKKYEAAATEDDKKKIEHYRGCWIMTPKSKNPVGIRSADNQRKLTEEAEFYGGCFARLSIGLFTYQNTEKVVVVENGQRKEQRHTVRGVSFILRAVQKAKDGPRLGGQVNAEDEFDALEVEDDEFSDEMNGGANGVSNETFDDVPF